MSYTMKDLLEAILILGGLFLFFFFGGIFDGNQEKKKFLKYKKQGLKFIKEYNSVKYYGGIQGLNVEDTGKVILFDDRVRILGYTILLREIESCNIQTERQITERVSMGKLLFFGVLAFGMKGKQRELSKKYIVLRYNEFNEMRDIVMDFGYKNEDFERYISITKKELEMNKNDNKNNISNVLN